ncbi:hypothetical protein C0995_012567 [Termitomyces sp. Mi166|nr:hypothetical protein C0995_012567 [Termitomyces sp. Mi166\
MEVDTELSYPHSIDALELEVVQLPKTKFDPKTKGGQQNLSKDKSQAVTRSKGKKKEKEQESSAAADEQLAVLFQHLHDAGVPEEVNREVLENSVAQLVFAQVLNTLNTTCQQRDEAPCRPLLLGIWNKEVHSLPSMASP